MAEAQYESRGAYLTRLCEEMRRQAEQVNRLQARGLPEAEATVDLAATKQAYEDEFGPVRRIGELLPEPPSSVNDLPLLEQFVRFTGLANIISHDVRPIKKSGGSSQHVKSGRLGSVVVKDKEGRIEQIVERGAEISLDTAYQQTGVSVQATGATLRGPAHYQGEYNQRVTTGSVHARAGLLGRFKDYVRGLEGAHGAEVDIFGISTETVRAGRAVLPSFDAGTTEIIEASYNRNTEFSAFIDTGILGNFTGTLPDGRNVEVSHGGSFERIEFNGEVREMQTFSLIGSIAQLLLDRG